MATPPPEHAFLSFKFSFLLAVCRLIWGCPVCETREVRWATNALEGGILIEVVRPCQGALLRQSESQAEPSTRMFNDGRMNKATRARSHDCKMTGLP